MTRLGWFLRAGLLVAAAFPSAGAASSWGFSDASLSIRSKDAKAGDQIKHTLSTSKPIEKPIPLKDTDNIKIVLTTQKDSVPEKPHQAFILFKNAEAQLDVAYPLEVKDSGKAKFDMKSKDIPSQLLQPGREIEASIVIASFGDAEGHNKPAFRLLVDPSVEASTTTDPLAYGKLDEIHHIFKPEAQSPPALSCSAFVVLVLATLPFLTGMWFALGANLRHLPKAFCASPIAHTVFLSSVISVEAVFYMYYTTWNLFQILPVLAALGLLAVVAGSRALGEVQSRRLAGLR
ncbi:Ribophorin II [Ascosphaera apis ARSEF 7405]|uniref:Ribophorin II n=1 Tax=Ascosphaera apis ARSEF 7405 TaxID=392613 RepID=A0A162IGE2_9EURO|nr:Ribophorin II [Ascosphaera apis ARSEF 7405]